MFDRSVLQLHKELGLTGMAFFGLVLVAILMGEVRANTTTPVLLGIAALGLVLVKVGETVVIAIGELRRAGGVRDDRPDQGD